MWLRESYWGNWGCPCSVFSWFFWTSLNCDVAKPEFNGLEVDCKAFPPLRLIDLMEILRVLSNFPQFTPFYFLYQWEVEEAAEPESIIWSSPRRHLCLLLGAVCLPLWTPSLCCLDLCLASYFHLYLCSPPGLPFYLPLPHPVSLFPLSLPDLPFIFLCIYIYLFILSFSWVYLDLFFLREALFCPKPPG